MVRVGGNDDPDAYETVGARSARRLMDTVLMWSARPLQDVLDWGCGPGRVASHILSSCPGVALRGCDVDAEAIAWCNANLAAGSFDVSSLYPPLLYPGESFDAVLACSVMTHLNRRDQRKWLRELSRVLRPGGVLAASVHGRAAAEGFGITEVASIDDHYLNIGLNGIVPGGYYRDVVQTEEYTRAAWSECFEVVAYEEAALELHDLVTCRVL